MKIVVIAAIGLSLAVGLSTGARAEQKPTLFNNVVYDIDVQVDPNTSPNDPTLPKEIAISLTVRSRTVLDLVYASPGASSGTLHFGDGESVFFSGPEGTSVIRHVYTSPGIKTVTLERTPSTSSPANYPVSAPTGWFRTVIGPLTAFDPGLTIDPSSPLVGSPTTFAISNFPGAEFGLTSLALQFNAGSIATFSPDALTGSHTFSAAGRYPLAWSPSVLWSENAVIQLTPPPIVEVDPTGGTEEIVASGITRLTLGGPGLTDANNEFNQRNVRLANNDTTLLFLSESKWSRNQILRVEENPPGSGLFEGTAVAVKVDPDTSELIRTNSNTFPHQTVQVGALVHGFEIAPDLSFMLIRVQSTDTNPRWVLYRDPFAQPARAMPIEIEGLEPWRPTGFPVVSVALDPFTQISADGTSLFLPKSAVGASGVGYAAFSLADPSPVYAPRFRREAASDRFPDQVDRLQALGRVRFWQTLEGSNQQLFAAVLDADESVYTMDVVGGVTGSYGWNDLVENASTWVELGALSADGRRLYFASNRTDSHGMMDIYRADINLVASGEGARTQRVQALLGHDARADHSMLDANDDALLDAADLPTAP